MSIGTDVIRLSQTASALLEFYEDDVESWGIEGRVASFDHKLQATWNLADVTAMRDDVTVQDDDVSEFGIPTKWGSPNSIAPELPLS